MTRVVSFGDFVFADIGTEFATNFGDQVPRTNRLPGLSGGFDEYGDGVAPSEIGNVRLSLILKAATAAAMQAQHDALNGLLGYGKQALVVEADDGTRRVCRARVQNISLSKRYAALPRETQRATINWQVSDPFWESETPAAVAQAVSGLNTTFTVTVGGNAVALPRIVVATGISGSCEEPVIERLVDGVAVDRIDLVGTLLLAGETLEIDCKSFAVRLDGDDAYGDTTFLHPAWFRLLPGANAVRVLCGDSGDAATVTFHFSDTWY